MRCQNRVEEGPGRRARIHTCTWLATVVGTPPQNRNPSQCHANAEQRRLPTILSSPLLQAFIMGKKGKKAQAGKPKKLTPKEIGKRLDALVRKLEEELKGADLFAPLPPTEDCPICCVPLSRINEKSPLWACCGNVICNGCSGESVAARKKQSDISGEKRVEHTCPFCRAPYLSGLGWMSQVEAKASQNDARAMLALGGIFECGKHGDRKTR